MVLRPQRAMRNALHVGPIFGREMSYRLPFRMSGLEDGNGVWRLWLSCPRGAAPGRMPKAEATEVAPQRYTKTAGLPLPGCPNRNFFNRNCRGFECGRW